MKFSSILVLASIVAQEAFVGARPFLEAPTVGSLVRRQGNNRNGNQGGNRFNFGGNQGGRNGGNRGGNGGNRGGNRATSAAASTAAATTAAAATASASAAANGGNGGNGGNGNGGNGNGQNGGGNQNGGGQGGNGGAGGNGNGGNQGGANGGAGNQAGGGAAGGDPQESLQLDPSQVGSNLASDGLAAGDPGQVASLTSQNNFINFCLTTGQQITNGQQVQEGSCNPVIMGSIPSKDRMPSCKFKFPKNGEVIQANQDFTIELAVRNMVTGQFTNPQTNYFAAPQQLQGGVILAHSHAVIEQIGSLDSVTVPDPTQFVFFRGLNFAAQGGILSTTVTGGLPAGFYKISSINTAANHQPVLGPIAQHGSFDDAAYFTVQ